MPVKLRICALVCLLAAAYVHAGGIEAAASAETVKVKDGLQCTLWASEPDVINPTNIDIDSRGRVWVVEGANYRGLNKLRPEGDRVMILEDTNGDGKCDSAKVFVQDPMLLCPLGICVLGNKVYVAQSPKMFVYTIDASGDKPAGPPEVLFDGFTGANHDHGLHAGVFGPDGRFYFNAGNDGNRGFIKNAKGEPILDSTGSQVGSGGKIVRGQPKQNNGYREGMAYRCNLDGSGFETLGHNFRNNYKLCVDSFGTVWQSDNDDDGNQGVRLNYVMEGGNFGYTGPGGWSGDTLRYPTQSQQEAHWHQRQPGIVPNLYNTGGGSPTGIICYEGDLLPEKYRGNLFHCNAGGQWHSYVGAFFTTPIQAGYKCELEETLTASDKYWKPSDLCVAPDGAVFVADWYDGQSGGHGMTDKIAGKQQGRIFRLAPTGNKPVVPKLDLTPAAGQIAALCSPNLSVRYEGYTKLAAGGADAQKALKNLYTNSKNQRHRARALWLLAQGADGKAAVSEALRDENPDIRVSAVRAARLIKMDMISVANQMLPDKSFAVLRELCIAMMYEPTEKCMSTLVQLADKIDPYTSEAPVFDPKARGKKVDQLASEEKERQERCKNRWYIEAVGIGAIGREKELLQEWTKNGANKDPKVADIMAWRMNKVIPELPPKPPAPPKTEVPKTDAPKKADLKKDEAK